MTNRRESPAKHGVIIASLVLSAIISGSCGTSVNRVGIFLSPDGSLIADWYQRFMGGAAGGIEDTVQLRKRSERFSLREDVVFRADLRTP